MKEENLAKKNNLYKLYKVLRKRVKLGSILLLLLTLSANTFAWFIYATKVDSGVKAHVRAWNVLFEAHDEEIEEMMSFDVSDIYPGMETYTDSVEVRNKGESSAKLSYEIVSINILGEVYEVKEGSILTSDNLINSLLTDYPFKISIGMSNPTINPGSLERFTLTVSWPYDSGDDEEDTYWGTKAYDYHASNPDSSSILINLKVSARQSTQ